MKLSEKLKIKGLFNVEEDAIQRSPEHLIEIYHHFLKFYKCWIPFSEFCEMPVPLTLTLLEKINRDIGKINPKPVIIMGYAKKSFVNKVKSGGRRA